MSNIFGNLDQFLEHYDDADLASTSALNDTRNSILNDSVELSKNEKRKGSGAKSKSNSRRSSDRVKTSKSSTAAMTRSVDEGSTIDTLASTPVEGFPVSAPSQPSIHGAAEEMIRLSSLFDSIFKSPNPIVQELLKNSNTTKLKRSYTTLYNSYYRKPPATAKEIANLLKKIEKPKLELMQLEQQVQAVLRPVSMNPFPPRTGRSRGRGAQATQPPATVVISLDCDDDPTPSQPIFQSNYRRVTRQSLANAVQSNVITLESDEENEAVQTTSAADNSFETENYEMRIKVKWGSGIETFVHRRYQKFDDIISLLAAKESADKACIFLNLDDRIVYPNDTPDTISYRPHQFISGRILKTKAPTLPTALGPSAVNSNMITLKVQMEKRKQPLRLQMGKQQTMSVLVIKCAEELGCEPKDIRLYFDGEPVENSDRPEDLELEGDEILDIRFRK